MQSTFTYYQKNEFVIRYQNGGSVIKLCLENGIGRSTFYEWVKKHDIENKKNMKSPDIFKLNQKLQKAEKQLEIISLVGCTIKSPLKTKLYELEKLQGKYSVHALCRALDVDRGTYYNHILRNKKQDTSYTKRRETISKLVQEVFDESNQIFGINKIVSVLKTKGITTSYKYVRDIMKELEICSIRNFSKYIYNFLNPKYVGDSICLKFNVKKPDEVWVSDTTYIKMKDHTYYLCAILDLYSRKIIAHKIGTKHSTNLISATFKKVFEERKPTNLTFHSDRGTQFSSTSFMKLLKSLNVTQSFSPSGRPCHNAVAESFFSNFKKEEFYRTNYTSFRDIKIKVAKYMDFYNTKRPHSYIKYLTPDAYERKYFEDTDKCVQNLAF